MLQQDAKRRNEQLRTFPPLFEISVVIVVVVVVVVVVVLRRGRGLGRAARLLLLGLFRLAVLVLRGLGTALAPGRLLACLKQEEKGGLSGYI